MQPSHILFAMLKAQQAFWATLLRSFLKTKSVLKTILRIWFPSTVVQKSNFDAESSTCNDDPAVEPEKFLKVVENAFRLPIGESGLISLSDGLRNQYLNRLEDVNCMLPSFNHQLPSGEECGKFLALDVGGSTFRVALIELRGRNKGDQAIQISEMKSYKINAEVKNLKGVSFFDWMAEKIELTLSRQLDNSKLTECTLSMGLSWSFPIEQTSLRSGRLQKMGKGFLAADGLLNQDLGDLIQNSCSRRGLDVQLKAIINDGSATLLSKAYMDPTTRFSVIVGTGMNAAVHLPVHLFASPKFGNRPSEWHASAKHVIVNTELSMFGGDILPITKWDKVLQAAHPRPNFQPFEHFVGGGYLGEIVRLVLIDAIEQAGLFGGVVPPSLRSGYSLETETLSCIHSDQCHDLVEARKLFLEKHPSSSPPSLADIETLRIIASHVTHRAASVLAAGIHSLWQLRSDAESFAAHGFPHTLVAYNGSVLENYPDFKATCQKELDMLVVVSGGENGMIELMYAEESSLLGAAVAGAVASDTRANL